MWGFKRFGTSKVSVFPKTWKPSFCRTQSRRATTFLRLSRLRLSFWTSVMPSSSSLFCVTILSHLSLFGWRSGVVRCRCSVVRWQYYVVGGRSDVIGGQWRRNTPLIWRHHCHDRPLRRLGRVVDVHHRDDQVLLRMVGRHAGRDSGRRMLRRFAQRREAALARLETRHGALVVEGV